MSFLSCFKQLSLEVAYSNLVTIYATWVTDEKFETCNFAKTKRDCHPLVDAYECHRHSLCFSNYNTNINWSNFNLGVNFFTEKGELEHFLPNFFFGFF